MGCRDLRFVSGKLKAVKPICSQELSERYIIDNFFFFFFFFFCCCCFVLFLFVEEPSIYKTSKIDCYMYLTS